MTNQPGERADVLIVIGGFAGSGKSTISRRLSQDLSIPRLDADALGKTIRDHELFLGTRDDAYAIGYSILWRLCDEFLERGISVIVDANMAWDIAWRSLDEVVGKHAHATLVPVILRCHKDECLSRIRIRYAEEIGLHGEPLRFTTEEAGERWLYLERLDRPDLHIVDASKPIEDVYEQVRMVLPSC